MGILAAILDAIRSFRPTIVAVNTFDPEACIGYLLNKREMEVNRVAAAESLRCEISRLGPHLSKAIDALIKIASDTSDDMIVREEAAGALGYLWSQIGVDWARLEALPGDIRVEVEASMPGNGGTAK